ncbi:MAG: ABC transporter permease [Gemmatimonadales bacterium]|nr:ABC transporter permease [Gemmatimonadales bacterium]
MTSSALRDLRYAGRRLLRSPGFTATAVLTLALGIGANTAIFSLVDAALLRPLPFREPDRLAVLWESQQAQGKEREKVSAANFLDWRRESSVFSDLAAWTHWGRAVTGAGEPEELSVIRASANLFDLLGVQPELGRGFLSEEETPGRERVVVLSHALWTQRFGAEPGVLGRTLTLDGEPYQIVGVMPSGFRFPGDESVALWSPLAFDASELVTRAERRFDVLGRLGPGISLQEARAELGSVAGRLSKEHAKTNAGWSVTLEPAAEVASAGSRGILAMLLGTVAFVLLIACANVGHLFLARAVDREREMAIRAALGAGPSRLARLVLLESGLVAAGGAALGVVLASWAVPAILALDPGVLPAWQPARLDGRVLLFTTALLVFTTVACGVLPALQSARADLRVPRRPRLRQGLIIGEVALSVVLLIAAGLLLRSLHRLQQVDPGFDPEHVLAATIFLSGSRYDDDARQAAFFSDLIGRLRAVPGVEAAGAVTTLPMNPVGIDYDLPFSAGGQPPSTAAEEQQVDFRVASEDYFQVIGIPLLRGRPFTAADRAGTPRVVVVNETLVRRLFPREDPAGRQVWLGGGMGQATIVGVVGEVRHRGLDARPRPEMYVPFRQYPHGGMTVVVRTISDPAALGRAVKEQVYALDPSQPVNDLITLPQLLALSVSPRRFNLLLLGAFAALALVLAAIGVYGVIAYSVSQRTREIGVRIALGAGGREIRRAVSRPGLTLTLAGVLLGSAAAWALTRLLGNELYEISPHDPLTFAAVALLILGVASAACEVPAWRASRTDPLIALRSE